MEKKIYRTDVLVIGSGGAGCRAAIEANKQNLDVIIISKGLSFKSGCTTLAEGGYNAAFGYVDKKDSVEAHFKDTLKGGAYLNDTELVRILVEEAPERLNELEMYGAIFDRQESGELNQRPFGGQTFRRTCFQGDRTGHEMMTALKEEVIKRDIKTVEEVIITSLLTDPADGSILGACGLSLKDSEFLIFQAKSTVLATGGAGWMFPVTSNAMQKTGDGFALAYQVGADLLDMEQVQFHPTGMLYPESRRGVLITEAVRGEGGRLFNSKGERFMKKYDPRGELATRDVVARAIYREIIEGRGTERGGVYLDVTHLAREVIEDKLETMLLQFLDVGIDIREQPMEVAPTAHHFMGGARINEYGETTVRNLFAAGEVTGGVHGANRLGGNALADTQVFGRRAGESAAKNALRSQDNINKDIITKQTAAERERIQSLLKDGQYYPFEIIKELQEVMWKNVAIIRNKEGLKTAINKINELKEMLNDLKIPNIQFYNKDLQDALEAEKLLNVAQLTAESALIREESRGAHFREDYPEIRDEWKKSIIMNKEEEVRFIRR